jgi:UDP-N-acetylmuramyl pentapeptide synthase
MLELGPGEAAYHEEVGRRAAQAGVGLLVTVGPRAARMGAAYTGGAQRHAADARAAAALVPDLLEPGDTVLVKASRGVGLEVVAQALEAAG